MVNGASDTQKSHPIEENTIHEAVYNKTLFSVDLLYGTHTHTIAWQVQANMYCISQTTALNYKTKNCNERSQRYSRSGAASA